MCDMLRNILYLPTPPKKALDPRTIWNEATNYILKASGEMQRNAEIMFSLTKSAFCAPASFFADKKQVIGEYIIKKSINRGEQSKVNAYRQLLLIMRDT